MGLGLPGGRPGKVRRPDKEVGGRAPVGSATEGAAGVARLNKKHARAPEPTRPLGSAADR
eukprot:5882275-Alexandrium_andersonii.AAC.1